jgi:hypothetical protein
MAQPATARRMEQVIRDYIQACNNANAEAIAACFCLDGTCYTADFPKLTGALQIANALVKGVGELGLCWTVDQLVLDSDRCGGVLEWTCFNRDRTRVFRGVDWFVFEPQTFRFQEVRSYSAAILNFELARQELKDFDYEKRGYPTM